MNGWLSKACNGKRETSHLQAKKNINEQKKNVTLKTYNLVHVQKIILPTYESNPLSLLHLLKEKPIPRMTQFHRRSRSSIMRFKYNLPE